MKKVYSAMDVTKFVLAIFIIAFHCRLFKDYNEFFNRLTLVFTNMAVPLFFAFSGFLAQEKYGMKHNISSFSVKRLLVLWIIWEIIYTPFVIWDNIHSYHLSWKECIWENYILGSHAHLWYIRATIIAFLLIILMYKSKVNLRIAYLSSFILYILGTLSLSYCSDSNLVLIFNKYCLTTRNGLFFGVPYVFLGVFFSIIKKKIDPILGKRINANMILGLFTALYVLETFMLSDVGQMTFFMYPLTFIILYYVVTTERRFDSFLFRKLSTYIYFIHFGVLAVILHILRRVNFENSIVLFLIGTVVTLFVSYMVIYLQKFKYFKWLKYLA